MDHAYGIHGLSGQFRPRIEIQGYDVAHASGILITADEPLCPGSHFYIIKVSLGKLNLKIDYHANRHLIHDVTLVISQVQSIGRYSM